MFDYTRSEIVAGGFVILGLALLGYLSISIGGLSILPQERYQLTGRFSNVGDLKMGAPVKLAGVTVGKVASIKLADYLGEAELAIDRKVVLPKDTIASIATAGLLGDAYVSLSPGASDSDLHSGDRITRTEPALNVADLLGRYAFGNPTQSSPSSGEGGTGPDKTVQPTTPHTTPTPTPTPEKQ